MRGEVFLPLFGKDWCFDWAARARPMARRTGWNVAARIAEFDQAHDLRGRIRERSGVWVTRRLRRVIGSNIGRLSYYFLTPPTAATNPDEANLSNRYVSFLLRCQKSQQCCGVYNPLRTRPSLPLSCPKQARRTVRPNSPWDGKPTHPLSHIQCDSSLGGARVLRAPSPWDSSSIR